MSGVWTHLVAQFGATFVIGAKTERAASEIWIPVVAALGASLLTGLILFGLDRRQARRAARSALADRRVAAYGRLLAVSGLIAHTADALRVTIEVRSGMAEMLDIALRLRKPMDPLDLLDVVRRDLEPLYEAWSDVWTVGTPDAVQIGNELVDQARRVLGAGTSLSQSRGTLKRYLAGERWSPAQINAYQDELARLARLRKRLAEHARSELGVGPADLFLDEASGDGHEGEDSPTGA